MEKLARRKKQRNSPSEERTISAILDSAEFVEEITVEGFRRGFNTKSQAAKKIIELGFDEFKKLPVIESRA